MNVDFDYYNQTGIVDKVRAVRNNAGEVLRLDVTIRVETGLDTTSYGQDQHVDEVTVGMPVDANVNPGDVVSLALHFTNPFGQRFQPALEVGESDEEEVSV